MAWTSLEAGANITQAISINNTSITILSLPVEICKYLTLIAPAMIQE
jgi:hypothetical protein